MIQNNNISYLMLPVILSVDGQYKIYFDVSGLSECGNIIKKRNIDYNFFSTFIKNLFFCILELYSYMLYPDNLMLDLSCIFYDENNNEFRFAYVPGHGKGIKESIKDIVEVLMKYIDHREQKNTEFVYKLYEYVYNDNFDICTVKEFIDSFTNDMTTDNTVNNSMELISDTTSNEDSSHENELEVSHAQSEQPAVKKDNELYKYILIAAMVITGLTGFFILWTCYTRGSWDNYIRPLMGILILLVVETFVMLELTKEKATEPHQYSQIKTDEKTNADYSMNSYVLIPMDDVTNKPYYIRNTYIVIGRDKECDLYLDCNSVSRTHARIYICSNNWVVEDMSSTNGTYINNYPVSPGYPAIININDVISFGQEKFTFGKI
jgi:hypothetical protein